MNEVSISHPSPYGFGPLKREPYDQWRLSEKDCRKMQIRREIAYHERALRILRSQLRRMEHRDA